MGSFEKLPGEIRMMIYRLVLHVEGILLEAKNPDAYKWPPITNPRPSVLPIRPLGHSYDDGYTGAFPVNNRPLKNIARCEGKEKLLPCCSAPIVFTNAYPEILRVCKLMHFEATEIFYGENVFVVKAVLLRNFYVNHLSHIGKKNRNYIRHVHIGWELDDIVATIGSKPHPSVLHLLQQLESLRQITYSVMPYSQCPAGVTIEPSVQTSILANRLVEIALFERAPPRSPWLWERSRLSKATESFNRDFLPDVFLGSHGQVSIFSKAAATWTLNKKMRRVCHVKAQSIKANIMTGRSPLTPAS